MERWTIYAPGGIADLVLESAETPAPGAGEALIRVNACSLNFADLLMLKGTYQSTPPFPFAPGGEVCGIVESVGEGCDASLIGQRVVAYCGHGGLSSHVVAPVDALAPVPEELGDAEAASIPVAYGSSDLSLTRRARLRAGEWMLVTGAGGGVGLTAVEIGSLTGANVIALARGEQKAEAARAAGALHVLDPDVFDLSGYELRDAILRLTGGARIDVIVDPVGGALSDATMRCTAFEARVLPLGFAGGDVPVFKANHLLVKNVDIVGFWWGAYFTKAPEVIRESFTRLLDWAASGRITPHISDRVPFADAPDALRLVADRLATGKVVVER